MSARGRHEFDLMGHEPADLVSSETLVAETDIEDIQYPAFRVLEKKKIIGIYLSNYLPWDTRRYSEAMIAKFDAKAAVNIRTFDTYDRIDDMTYMGIHDLLKYGRVGYTRVTDSLCREIRFGRISKEDARTLESHYQGISPTAEVQRFSRWLGLWEGTLDWFLHFLPNHGSFQAVDLNPVQQKFVNEFKVNYSPVHNTDNYIVYGKGLENFGPGGVIGDTESRRLVGSWK